MTERAISRVDNELLRKSVSPLTVLDGVCK